jgi:preprotein translocase subunit SecF
MTKFSVIKQRSLWWGISASLALIGIIAAIVSFIQLGAPIRPSLEFVGGTRLQLELACAIDKSCEKAIDLDPVRAIMAEQGLPSQGLQVVDNYGLSIRTRDLEVDPRQKFIQALEEKIGKFDPSSTQIDTVGPTIGKELLKTGIISLFLALAGITVYLSFRFQWDYAMFAMLALVHDVGITVGIFALLGLILGIEADSLFVVALLTIVGFSVNDTVVIYDRVREIMKLNPNNSIDEIVDDAVNQTLTRSINTTATTLLPLTAIFIFGGDTLKYFALALIIGFILGAYSSIFIASTALAWWRERQTKVQATVLATAGEAPLAVAEEEISREEGKSIDS